MLWFMIGHLFTTLPAWVSIGRLSNQEKALALLVLRQQVRMLERQLEKPVRRSRNEKLTLAILTAQVKTIGQRSAAGLRDVLLVFQPETVLKWHRELVRRLASSTSSRRSRRRSWGPRLWPLSTMTCWRRKPFSAMSSTLLR